MRIGILTAFSGMVEHYSLTRVVLDQLQMIKRAKHEPVLIVLSDFQGQTPDHVEVRRAIPTHVKVDYKSLADLNEDHSALLPTIQHGLREAVKDLDAVLTHDIIFTGWNLPINLAMGVVAAEGRIPWFHWIHSVPGGKRDYWTLPANSKLVYPNYTDRRRCAESFGIFESDVVVVPHALDASDFLLSTDEARNLVNDFDLLDADFVQTFPVPTDRFESKGFSQIVPIFGKLKRMGKKVRLVVANCWCTNEAMRRKIDDARILCRLSGLDDEDVVFTSRELENREAGVPNNVVRDLMLISNLFICPTKSETFGFTIAEAALAGQLLVLNSDLPAIVELVGARNALFFHFGSYQQQTYVPDEDQFAEDIAKIICRAYENDFALKAKDHYKKTYRADKIWRFVESAILETAHASCVA